MRISKINELKRGAFVPIKSFRLQDDLNPKLWNDFEIDNLVRKQLITIAKDFYEGCDLQAKIKDIVLCGSLCNYNWSEKYSDFDLHIIIDFIDVDDEYELVENLCDLAKKMWNTLHQIKIKGYDVEIAIQDSDVMLQEIEDGKMGGVFSLKNNKWIKIPEKIEFKPNERMIKEKSKVLMMLIDEIEEDSKTKEFSQLENRIKKVWNKIKDYRKSGLESESGEFSIGNLIFKLLRRNGYIDRFMELKRKLYDSQFK